MITIIKNKRIYQTLLVLVILCSCEKYLDKTPDNRTEINSVEKVGQLLASAYPASSYAAILNSRVDYVSDKGPGFQENVSNSDAFFWRDVTDVAQDTPEYFWGRCYFSIAEANHALDASNSLQQGQKLSSYVGEAYVIRAFSHFLLVSLYSKFYDINGNNGSPGIPYVTEPEKTVIKEYSRGTVEEVWDKIEEDFDTGFPLLGSDAQYSVPRYHFTKKAAAAFASRFYLYKGDWNKVIEYANTVFPEASVMTANNNVASTDAANVYAANNFQPWLGEYATVPSSNDIKTGYTIGTNPSNLLLTEMSSRMSRYANTWRYATKKVDTDATVASSNVTGGSWAFRVYSSGDNYYVPKYKELFVRTSINATTGTIYTIFPYFRNEEVLLNRAEAYAMTDRIDKAIADLNVYARQRIRSYSETTHVINITKLLSFYDAAIDNSDHYMNKYNAYGSGSWSAEKKAVILCILEFRRNEFMWEGLRYWDLIRYKIPVTHKTFDGIENTLFPGDDRWVLQVPESAKLSGIESNPRENLLSNTW
jgi:hypothetical protein